MPRDSKVGSTSVGDGAVVGESLVVEASPPPAPAPAPAVPPQAYVVAPGRTVFCRRGALHCGDAIQARDVGEEVFKNLQAAGSIVAK